MKAMPVVISAETWDCAVCGAPLPDPSGKESVRCDYCDRVLRVSRERHATQAMEALSAPTLREELLAGPTGRGEGGARRFPSGSPEGKVATDPVHMVWPIRGRASSTYGGGWSPDTLVGPPRVYPKSGDRRGAWAPGRSRSRTEWVEVEFQPDITARAVRVFETNCAGSTYAMTLVAADGGEETLYRGSAALQRGAAVLEVRVDPPRPIRAIRAYVDNRVGRSWSEVDTIGLVSATPLPEAMRRSKPIQTFTLASISGPSVGCVLFLLAFVAGVLVMARGSETPPLPAPRSPAERVAGAELMRWNISAEALRGRVIWADAAAGVSSEYGDGTNPASAATGAPDVYPAHVDSEQAWAPSAQDRGEEWIELRWDQPTEASAVIWVETFNPGAVKRVDDITDPGRPVTLWEGPSESRMDGARVASLELPSPRALGALRIVLDTTRAAGWNEIDAVGLVAALP